VSPYLPHEFERAVVEHRAERHARGFTCWGQFVRGERRPRLPLQNKLLTLDATLIELCASAFDWTQYRRTKGAVKLHLLLDHQGLLPSYSVLTQGRVHESRIASTLRFEPGTIVVFDRGYNDYDWFAALDRQGVFFVTRIKNNTDYGVLEHRPVPERGAVQRDLIAFLYKLARQERDLFPRRIEIWDEQNQRTLVFLTNHRHFAASTIAQIYKSRWQIELLFKALKQNLRVKTFVGTSALQIQIWTALIALLLLKYLQLRARFGRSLSNLVALLRQQLFVYRELWAWIDHPFQPPPLLDSAAEQIPFSWLGNLDSRTPTSTPEPHPGV
jgi:hypothetical protein